jgi:hypothetical protein
MQMLFLSVLIALASEQTLFGQAESFDIATFIRPPGWTRAESNGILVLQDRKTLMGRAVFCQIYLFPSQPSNSTAAVNYAMEWDARIRRTYGGIARPTPQTEVTPDGWTVLSASADVVWQRVPMRIVLATSTGFGRMISVMVAVSPNRYQAELEAFFLNLNFHDAGRRPAASRNQPLAAEQDAPVSSTPGTDPRAGSSLANYVYAVPQQWSKQELRDRIVLTSPNYPLAATYGPNTGQTTENCQLTLLPLRPVGRPLQEDAIGTFREMFRADPLTTYPSGAPIMTSGISAQGWEYFIIRKLVGGQEGEARATGVTLLLAKIANQVATIVGTSKDFLFSACFSELNGDAWPGFFYSLRFENARPSGQEGDAIRQRLTGNWVTATANLGLSYQFQADGHYASVGSVRSRVTDQAVQASSGGGSYSMEGNILVLRGDDNRRQIQLFRVARVSRDSGQSWQDQLCLMEPGSKGEVCFKKR